MFLYFQKQSIAASARFHREVIVYDERMVKLNKK